MSISPNFRDHDGCGGDDGGDEEEDDEGDEDLLGMPITIKGDRLGLDKEEEMVRTLRDPKRPSQEEIDKHWVIGAFTIQGLVPGLCVRQGVGDGTSSWRGWGSCST